jgi:1,4-alpha-glucan branching enzyme
MMVCVSNLSAVPRTGYRVPLPRPGPYTLVLNSDADEFGGDGHKHTADFEAEPAAWRGRQFSGLIDLPPLSTLWFSAPPPSGDEAKNGGGGLKPSSS